MARSLGLVLALPWLACASAPTSTSDTPAGPGPAQISSTAVAEPSAPAALTQIELIPRNAWGAKPVRGTLVPHALRRLTVHHSAQRAPDVAGAPARIRGFQAFHQSKSFPDIAYHYIIDRAGNVYEGRDETTVGSTFTKYDPTGHFLALLDGNFEVQQPTAAQMEALARLLAWASVRHAIPTSTISGHRDHAATACPGTSVYAAVQSGLLKRRVDDIVASGPVELVRLGDAEGKARVKAIVAGDHAPGLPRP
jgi:hypothetical protein